MKQHQLSEPIPLRPSVEPAIYVGRVACDAEGKPNDKSLLLASGAADGRRMALDLSEVPQCALFPGQVVAVKGASDAGVRLDAQAVYDAVPPAPLKISQADLAGART